MPIKTILRKVYLTVQKALSVQKYQMLIQLQTGYPMLANQMEKKIIDMPGGPLLGNNILRKLHLSWNLEGLFELTQLPSRTLKHTLYVASRPTQGHCQVPSAQVQGH